MITAAVNARDYHGAAEVCSTLSAEVWQNSGEPRLINIYVYIYKKIQMYPYVQQKP